MICKSYPKCAESKRREREREREPWNFHGKSCWLAYVKKAFLLQITVYEDRWTLSVKFISLRVQLLSHHFRANSFFFNPISFLEFRPACALCSKRFKEDVTDWIRCNSNHLKVEWVVRPYDMIYVSYLFTVIVAGEQREEKVEQRSLQDIPNWKWDFAL